MDKDDSMKSSRLLAFLFARVSVARVHTEKKYGRRYDLDRL